MFSSAESMCLMARFRLALAPAEALLGVASHVAHHAAVSCCVADSGKASGARAGRA